MTIVVETETTLAESATIASVGTVRRDRHRHDPDRAAGQRSPQRGRSTGLRDRPHRRHDEGLRRRLGTSGTRACGSQIAPPTRRPREVAQTDFVGIAIHCADRCEARGICTGNTGRRGRTRCPTRHGGYAGYKALFGAKYVNPAINNGSPASTDLNGQPIDDPFGQPRLPGLRRDVRHATPWARSRQMQEAGIPVTFGYISDAHDGHGVAGNIALCLRARRGRLRPAAQGLRHRRSRDFFTRLNERRDHQGQHPVRGHRRGERPLRRHRTRQRRLRRRHDGLHLRERARDRGQRRPPTARRHVQRDPRHQRDHELQRPQRHGAERLHHGQPGPGLGRPPATSRRRCPT